MDREEWSSFSSGPMRLMKSDSFPSLSLLSRKMLSLNSLRDVMPAERESSATAGGGIADMMIRDVIMTRGFTISLLMKVFRNNRLIGGISSVIERIKVRVDSNIRSRHNKEG